jgi:hypothetical protein
MSGNLLINGSIFSVGGVITSFYPVVIDASTSWFTGYRYTFCISRSDVHLDASQKGAMNLRCEGHHSKWGHNVAYLKYDLINGQGYTYQQFVAGVAVDELEPLTIVLLRGATNYFIATTGCVLLFNNPSGTSYTTQKSNPTLYQITTSINANYSGTYYGYDSRTGISQIDTNLTVGNNITALGSVSGSGMVINNPSGWNYLQFLKGEIKQFLIEVTPSNNYTLLGWNGLDWIPLQTTTLASTLIIIYMYQVIFIPPH